MQRARYTVAQKAEALELLATVGLNEAARITGIPVGTIASWGSRSGVKAPEVNRTKAMRTAQIAWSVRRATLADQLGEVAELATAKLRQLIEDDQVRAGDLARALAVVIDRAQLLSGGATVRAETVERTPEAEAEVARVLNLVREAA